MFCTKSESLCKWINQLDNSRKADTKKLQQQVELVRRSGNYAFEKMKTAQADPENLAELHKRMDCYENRVCSFTQEKSLLFDDYTMRELLLEKDLRAFESNLAQWSVYDSRQPKAGKASRLKSASLSAELTVSQVNHEKLLITNVRALDEKILQVKGHKEGWDDMEHELFLKILNEYHLSEDILMNEVIAHGIKTRTDATESNLINYMGKSQLGRRVYKALCKCSKKIVMRSTDAIQTHFYWYLEYLKLVGTKKQEISYWKLLKEKKRRHTVDNIKAESSRIKSMPLSDVCCNDATASDELIEMNRQKKESERRRAKNRQLVREWKAAKESRDEERCRQEQKREKEKAMKMQKLFSEKKQKVVIHKMKKEEEAMRTQEEKQDPQISDPKSTEFLRINYRDAIHSARIRRNMLEERAMKNQHQLPDRPKLIWCKNDHKITMEEVQSKLMDPTQSSLKNQLTKVELEERSRHREESQAHSLLIPCIDAIRDVTAKSFGHIPIQPRSIPSWRQNLRCA
ncbi:unnamed protein product [Albugo candida]|nr:unnamed protein product [Albugo candida]|eukprot:CCI40954.1 unnamed protein product [Albugo candida]